VEVLPTGVLFLRSQGPYDPVNCLWFQPFLMEEDRVVGLGDEQVVVDPLELLTDDADLPAAERARRERMREQGGGITAYSLAAPTTSELAPELTSELTEQLVCFALNGLIFVADIFGTTKARQLDAPSGAFDPRISPNGEYVAYIHDGDVHVQHLAGSDVVIAHDDDPQITWGMADFNAAEEFDRFRGFWWSPDSTQLAVARVDNTRVATWWIADPANPAAAPQEHKYPVAGSENAEVTLWLIGLDGTQTQTLVDETDEYLLAVRWSDTADTPALLATFLDRGQQHRSTYRVAADGSAKRVLDLRDDRWIELTPGTPQHAASGIISVTDLTASARPSPSELGLEPNDTNGDRRLLRYPLISDSTADSEGTADRDVQPTALTPAHWLVEQVAHVDALRALVTIVDRSQGPAYRSIAIAPLDGATPIIVVGGADDLGVHSVAAAAGSLVIARSASIQRRRPEHRLFKLDNNSVHLLGTLTSFAAVPLVAPTPTFLRAGLRQLPVAVFLPTDPQLRADGVKLPIVLDPYGGPHHAKVAASRTALAASQWLADQGFAVVIVDGRGTPGLGPEFERAIHMDLAGPVLADQVVGLLEAAASVPQLDLTRVGIRGWSFGGYLAALAVLRRPDVFHCAVVGAPVIDWRLYDTGYTERYLGNPADDDEPYARASLLEEAATLTRPVQLIHGLADDNVVAANTLRFSSALLAAGIPHEVFPLSGVTHMAAQEEVAENLVRLEVEFLRRHLGLPKT
jgi:dipeptidyl-peptidase 4